MEHGPPSRGRHLPLLLASLGYLALVWRFDWLCDDSYITFRYARNLAEGAGLTYNPPERVEGYTNFLWTLWLALFEAAGVDVTLAARASSVAAGLWVLALLARLCRTRLALSSGATLAVLAFPAALPPFAVWSTSGLETMPFTCALLLACERLVGDRDRPRAVQAGLAAAAAALLRADGALGVALVLGALLVAARREPRLRRAVLAAIAIALAAFGAHMAWRWAYYGALEPNTARVKVELGAITTERGAKYLGTFLTSYPAVLVALALGMAGSRHGSNTGALLAAPAWAGCLGYAAYSVLVGGDFMAMGRFLVPALPFAALLAALGIARVGMRPGALAAGAMLALSLLGAFDRHLVPRAWREALFFRWSAENYLTELEQWKWMKAEAERWVVLGLALERHTERGEALICGTIGAVGYHSRLWIHDPFGLVNREAFHTDEGEPERRSPGHHRRIPFPTFMQYSPEYLDAELVPRQRTVEYVPRWLHADTEYGARCQTLYLPIDGIPGADPGDVLRLIRWQGP